MLGAGTGQLQWLKEDGTDRISAQLKWRQFSPNCLSARPAPSVQHDSKLITSRYEASRCCAFCTPTWTVR
jgi:hypothetical protein